MIKIIRAVLLGIGIGIIAKHNGYNLIEIYALSFIGVFLIPNKIY